MNSISTWCFYFYKTNVFETGDVLCMFQSLCYWIITSILQLLLELCVLFQLRRWFTEKLVNLFQVTLLLNEIQNLTYDISRVSVLVQYSVIAQTIHWFPCPFEFRSHPKACLGLGILVKMTCATTNQKLNLRTGKWFIMHLSFPRD